jgi:hypothetical protein
VSMGHVSCGCGGGHGFPLGGGLVTTGGTVIGGVTTGGSVIGGRVTGGLTMGGRIPGGLTIGGREDPRRVDYWGEGHPLLWEGGSPEGESPEG